MDLSKDLASNRGHENMQPVELTLEQKQLSSIFEQVTANQPDNKGDNNKGDNNKGDTTNVNKQVGTQSDSVHNAMHKKALEDFYGIKISPPKSETPSLFTSPVDNMPLDFSNYTYRYASGFLSDASYRRHLEDIMTAGMHSTGKYIPLGEWQSFTKEGDCIIAVKYLEYNASPTDNNQETEPPSTLNEEKITLHKGDILQAIKESPIITEAK